MSIKALLLFCISPRILSQKTQYILIPNSICYHVFMQAVAKSLVVRFPKSFLEAFSANMGVPVKPIN
jgi:hypothetical protein